MKCFFSVLVLVLAVCGSGQAQDQHVVTEVDPGIGIAIDLDRRFRLDFFAGREKSEELESSKAILSGGLSFRTKPVFKSFLDNVDSDKQHVLVAAVTYEHSRASEAGEKTIEHKLMFDGTARWEFPNKVLMNNRNRVEFRWVNGEYRFRYRNRLMAERPLKIKRLQPSPYVSAEAYWDKHYERWSQFRFTGGVTVPMIKRSSLDLFYQRQHCITCADAQTNIFGVTLNLYLRRRK